MACTRVMRETFAHAAIFFQTHDRSAVFIVPRLLECVPDSGIVSTSIVLHECEELGLILFLEADAHWFWDV